MALDTKYRPLVYRDVLGQANHAIVLCQYIKEGKGFHQSYLFCGMHGSGKTTMGRILARALLCENPQEGNPCDECESCKIFLTPGAVHENFEELDAASKSGKGDLERIIEDVTYSTFSGKRRIYLFDESHRLSKAALTILLKPMEDNVEGSEDKKLVCIFCTTEPNKMVSTVFSRCAPAFVIRAVEPEGIAERLAFVCSQESYQYDLDALVTIAEITECHIRDALKTVEGVAMLGPITRDSVSSYLRLGVNDQALSLLAALGNDLPSALALARELAQEVSPSNAYERLAEASLYAYQAHLKVGKIPSQWNADAIVSLSSMGSSLLGVSLRFAAPAHRPTRHTLILDIATAHHALAGNVAPSLAPKLVLEVSEPPSPAPQEPIVVTPSPEVSPRGTVSETISPQRGMSPSNGKAAENAGGVWIDPRGIGAGPSADVDDLPSPPSGGLTPELFRNLVRYHLQELSRGGFSR